MKIFFSLQRFDKFSYTVKQTAAAGAILLPPPQSATSTKTSKVSSSSKPGEISSLLINQFFNKPVYETRGAPSSCAGEERNVRISGPTQ